MPRLRRRRKIRSTIRLEDLLIDEMLDLAGSHPWQPPRTELDGVLRSIQDVEDFYYQHRYRFRVCHGRPCDEDHHELFCSLPGTRPWVWWKFEAGYDQVPSDQVKALKALRALQPGEKRAALRGRKS